VKGHLALIEDALLLQPPDELGVDQGRVGGEKS
jgi:hypothetical protein